MNASKALDFRIFETGNHAEHPPLFRPLHPGLKADHVKGGSGGVLLAKLDYGVRPSAGARIGETHGLHATKGQGLTAPFSQDLDRKTALEVTHLLELPELDLLGAQDGIDEGLILLLVERAVHVGRIAALVVSGGPKSNVEIDRIGRNDGSDCIVVGKMLGPDRRGDVSGETTGGERSSSNHHEPFVGNAICDFMNHFDKWVLPHATRDLGAEGITVDRKGATRRNPMKGSHLHDQRTGAGHLFFELPDRVVQRRPSKRIRADQLGHVVRLLCGGM
jgi:hypothetical protein